MKFFVLVLFFVLPLMAAPTKTNDDAAISDLEKRIQELEQRQSEMNEWYTNFYLLGKGRVTPYLNESIVFGGFFESAVTHLYGPDMESQSSANVNNLGIDLKAKFGDRMQFVTQTITQLSIPLLNVHNNPNLTPSQRQFTGYTFFAVITEGYLEYKFTDTFQMQAGIGRAPYGIVLSQSEPEYFRLRGGSQINGYDDRRTVGIASPLWMGLHFLGFLKTDHSIGYNIYSLTPINAVDSLGIGGRFWLKALDATIGASVQSGEQGAGSYFSHGFDVDYKLNDFGFVVEYGHAQNSGNLLDTEFYYIEPYYMIPNTKWLAFVNAEYLDILERVDLLTGISDPVKIWQYSLGVNWIPLENVRLRLTYIYHDYLDETDSINGQKRDYNTIDFSTALAF